MTHLPASNDKLVILYVTLPDINCGKDIARSAIGLKLAACANILPAMTAIYEWEGQVKEENEVVLLLKTGYAQVGALMDHVTVRHPYDTPCIMELPVGRINDGYAAWLNAQLR